MHGMRQTSSALGTGRLNPIRKAALTYAVYFTALGEAAASPARTA